MFVYEKDSNVDYMGLVDDRALEQARIFLNERNQAYIKKEIEKKSLLLILNIQLLVHIVLQI